jgi:hypothetical protein
MTPSVFARPRAGSCLLGLLLLLCPFLLRGAPEPELIDTYEEWEVYVLAGEPGKICYIASDPVEADPGSDPQGKTWVLVTHRPGDAVRNEVSVLAAHDYQPETDVTIVIDTHHYRLFTQGDSAWLRTREEEADMVLAMKRGRRMTVVGRSAEGATTTDKFSLMGFTAALRAADQACPPG